MLKKSNTTFFKIRFIARIVSSFIFETQQFKTLEQDLVNVGQASPDSSGSRFGGTVEVRNLSATPAIKIWGFIKVEGTLRVFYLYK